MELQDGNRYAASLLDGDNELLATGESQFRISESRGVFWPSAATVQDTILKSASSLKAFDGNMMRIRKIKRCADNWPPHYHFVYDQTGQ